MAEFKDTSTYSQGDTIRTPRTFTAHIGKSVRLVVTRHVHYAQDEWIMICHPEIVRATILASKEIRSAQFEALSILKNRCKEIAKLCKDVGLSNTSLEGF